MRKREGRLGGGRVSRRAALQLRAAFGRRLLVSMIVVYVALYWATTWLGRAAA